MNKKILVKIIKKSILLFSAVGIISCSESGDSTRKAVEYPISDNVKTTLSQTLKIKSYTKTKKMIASDVELFFDYGYGLLEEGAGEPHLLKKDFVDENYSVPAENRKSLLFFPQITDLQLTDVESPVRSVYGMTIGNGSAYRSHAIYAPHILDAMIQTISYFHAKEKMDVVLTTGDMIDNNEYAEMVIFNTTMNGGTVSMDTGEVDDPKKGSGNDFADPFIAKGLPEGLKWYSLVGNHDALVSGIFYPTETSNAKFIGDEIPTTNIGVEIYTGTQDASTQYAKVKCGFQKGVKDNGDVYPLYVTVDECKDPFVYPDPNRKLMKTRQELIAAINDGKKYDLSITDEQSGYYSFKPNSEVPVEIIMLDTAAARHHYMVNGELREGKQNEAGFLDEVQFNWLKTKLNTLQSQGVLAIIAQHHPTYGFNEDSEVSGEELKSTLKSYNNIIALIVGHGHRNRIDLYSAENENEYPFTEIQTASLLDYPEQGRLFEFVYNGDGNISLITTVFNHASDSKSMAYLGRQFSLAHDQVLGSPTDGNPVHRNLEIIIPVKNNEIKTKLESLTGLSSYVKTLKLDN